MKDIALVPGTNKFLWRRKGMTMTDGRLQYMEQKVRAALSLFKGEWYLDTSLGIPYVSSIDMEKAGHRSVLEGAARAKVASLDGVEKLLSFAGEFDAKDRTLRVSLVARCDGGETLEMDDIAVGGAA